MKIPTEWTIYRRKSILAFVSLVVGFPSVIAIAIGLKVLGFTSPLVLILLSVSWCFCWGYFAFRVVRCPCPRCGKPFLLSQEPQFQIKRSCGNCGLGLYEKP